MEFVTKEIGNLLKSLMVIGIPKEEWGFGPSTLLTYDPQNLSKNTINFSRRTFERA